VTGAAGGSALEGGPGDKRPGLLASLMAAVRPEFRASVLLFDPGDPVFGGPACRVRRCGRTARTAPRAVLCYYHHRRWKGLGRPAAAGGAGRQVTAGARTTRP
jgi:hypothetical protein